MQLDLTRLRRPQQRFDYTIDPSAVPQEGGGFRVIAPVELGFDIHKAKAQFRLVGRVRTTLELSCGRCLEPIRLPVDSSFDVRYHPQSESATDTEHEVEDADLDDAFYRDDQIDLDELIQEQMYLTLPMKPLCRDDCKGLCPECGTNLNSGTCDCRHQWTDPRLEALKGLVRDERGS